MKNITEEKQSQKISRQEALKKAGKYAAFTAAAAIILLAPKAAQAEGSMTVMGEGFNHNRGSSPSTDGGTSRSPFAQPERSSSSDRRTSRRR